MDASRFDALIRSLTGTRRSLVGGTLAVAAGWLGVADADAGKKRKRKRKDKPKKPRPNEYGCLDVDQACNGDSSLCCSGICEGSKPKKGKKDSSHCVAHDAGICKVDYDLCSTGGGHSCNLSNVSCVCFQTTGHAGFCGDVSGGLGPDLCRDCSQDTDCEEEFGAGAACVIFDGICGGFCPDTGGTACMPTCAGS